ncbi:MULTISPECIES: GAF domain-containing protein [Deinococcus]|uniref:histidine kinase n=1 Tax=Deinococcus rufus TaxID=2136097 RepID=A0ABV7Z9H3_9DEIO|nr:GAF domain-containing protein [Deinococcus sp. AB2017081]WQE97365.1 GAF domain-containing protein [Deinococcus sp. AB2017081]
MSPAPGRAPTLADRLQRVTGQLATTHDRHAICRALLAPAMEAVDAAAGAVLIVSDSGDDLTLEAVHGHAGGAPILWPGGPLAAGVQPGSALLGGHARYFEHEEALRQAFPDLQDRAGAGAAMSAAILPLTVEHRTLGSLVVQFREPRPVTPDERRYLETLASLGALALDRSHAIRGLERRSAALNAFLTFSEMAAVTTDLQQLVAGAQDVLLASLPDAQGVYFGWHGDRWRPVVETAGLPDTLRALLAPGLPADVPQMSDAVRRQDTLFVEERQTRPLGFPLTDAFGALAVTPVIQHGVPTGLFVIGIGAERFTPEQREYYRAVAGSLTSAMNRAQTRQAGERQAALDAFVVLTEAIGTETDPVRLARRARDLFLAFLPGASVGYYGVDGELWRATVAHVPYPHLSDLLVAGLPTSTPAFAAAVAAGGPIFIDGWDAAEQRFERTEPYGVAAFCPYFAGGVPVGMFVVGLEHTRTWAEPERAVFRAVARSLGLALEWSRQAQQLRQQNEALEAFAAFTETSADTVDVATLIQRAGEVLTATLGDISVAHYDLADGRWWARAWYGDIPADHLAGMQRGFPADTPRFVRAVQGRRPLFVSDWQPEHEGLPTSAGYRAVVSYPYFDGQRPVSLLSVGMKHRTVWSAREETVVRAVGRSLGLALERARSTQQLESESAGLMAFVAFAEAVGTHLDVPTVARQAMQVVRAHLGEVSVAYYEPSGGMWRATLWSEDLQPEVAAQISAGVPGDAPDFERATRALDGLFIDAWDAGMNSVDSTKEYRAVAFFPLHVGGEVHGLLVAGTLENRAWTERERSVFRAVGRSLGLALERGAHVRELQRQRDALDVQTAALSAANEELEAFTYSASHDLRTPIRHVMGFADMARRALEHGQPDKVVRHLDIVRQGATRMETLIDGMLTLSRAGRQDFRPQKLSLEPLVTQAMRDAELDFPDVPVQWHLEHIGSVWGDPVLLQQVITTLVSNAVKFSSTRETADIRITLEDRGREWAFSVQDHGVGFDPLYAGKLFGIFQRLHPQDVFPGAGVGLATVRRIVLKHGGRVFAEGVEQRGATFGFTLPMPA